MSLTAFLLVLAAAFIHAGWNLLAKRAGGGSTMVWMAAVAGCLVYVPLALALGLFQQVEWTATTILFLLGSGVLQILYFITLQAGYRVGDLSLIYPLARGTGPLFATLGAILILGESPSLLALCGAALIVVGVFALASTAPASGLNRGWAVGYGLLTGIFIASYTLWDKVAVSALLIMPLLLTTCTVTMRAVLLAPSGWRNWPGVQQLWREHKWEVIGVGVISEISYFLVLTAMRTTPVSYVAPAREMSILIATVMGARLLAEGHLRQRLAAASAIVAGVAALVLG